MEKDPTPKKIDITFKQAMSILLPYSWHQIKEQMITVAPVCLYLVFFQVTILKYSLHLVGWIAGGTLLVIMGLVFFLEGVRIGLVPIGETIGDTLPKRCGITTVLFFAFFLGILAAFGEPVIGSLQIAGASVDPTKAPLLYIMLVQSPVILAVTISVSVGIAVLLGTLRFIYGWSLKPIILPIILMSVGATIIASNNHQLASAIGLAWDTGAVIVGPVLCPLVLSLGLGVCRATGRSDSGMAGFGMVALISLLPIIFVIFLTYLLSITTDTNSIILGGTHHKADSSSMQDLLLESFTLGLRAVAPIFIFLYGFMRIRLRATGIPIAQLMLGLAFAILGLFLFNFGLSTGLSELGNQVGQRLPQAFHPIDQAIYPSELGKIIVVVFAFILGYGATLAEPAFNLLGQQVEDVTQGAFKKWLFSQAVALGVGVGAALGIISVVYQVDLLYFLLPPYAVLFVLTILNDEKYVNIAWDGGAVTTGPVTVPLKLAIGIALSHATGFAEGFGILALASAYPVLNILFLGLYVKRMESLSKRINP